MGCWLRSSCWMQGCQSTFFPPGCFKTFTWVDFFPCELKVWNVAWITIDWNACIAQYFILPMIKLRSKLSLWSMRITATVKYVFCHEDLATLAVWSRADTFRLESYRMFSIWTTWFYLYKKQSDSVVSNVICVSTNTETQTTAVKVKLPALARSSLINPNAAL